MPDKELFPERWEFYDFDLNFIKEDIGKVNNFAQNYEREEFLNHEKE